MQKKGKPSPRLYLNPEFAGSIGVSLNTDTVSIAVSDFAGNMQVETRSIDGLPMQQVLHMIDDTSSALLAQRGIERRVVMGLGFAIAGYRVNGKGFNAPEPLREWSLIDLGTLLTRHFNLPVWTENGANTGTLCEQMFGVGRDCTNFAYLSFNYGFGGGVVSDGRLVIGGFGNAGEFSGIFTPQEHHDRPRLRSLIETLQANGVKIKTVHDLAEKYDPTWPGIAEWVARVQPALDRVINVLSAVVDPEVIVFGGQIPKALAQQLIDEAGFYGDSPQHKARYGVPRQMSSLAVSALETGADARGAALLPLKALVF